MSILRNLAVAGVTAFVAVAPAAAQVSALGGAIVITPYVGVYAPSTDIGRLSMASGATSADAWMKQQRGAAVGTTVSYWLTGRVGLEGGVVYSSSDLKGSLSGVSGANLLSQRFTEHANIWLANTKLMLQLLPPESDFNLRFGVGPALITRSGSAYREVEGKDVGLTDVGAAMSLCTRFGLGPKVGLRLRAEDFVYRARLGYENSLNPFDNFSFGARTQHDFVFSAGVQLFLNR